MPGPRGRVMSGLLGWEPSSEGSPRLAPGPLLLLSLFLASSTMNSDVRNLLLGMYSLWRPFLMIVYLHMQSSVASHRVSSKAEQHADHIRHDLRYKLLSCSFAGVICS